MRIDLSGNVAVVTGADGQLGRLWVQTLCSVGADVVGLDLGAEAPPGRFTSPGPDGSHGCYLRLQADVTSRESVEDSLRQCIAMVGAPTILVNNAGVDSPPRDTQRSWRFEDIPDDVSASILDVNSIGVLRMCQAYGSHMASKQGGSIVNIGSLYASVAPCMSLYEHLEMDPPFLKPPAYGMSKAGVSALTRYLAAMWAPRGVRVNTLAPGGVLGNQDAEFRRKFVARVPLGRMAEPIDLVGPLLFLASDLSSYVTGHELVVDGGYVCW
jgi:NAD(P)-dependent dehydrogenase (short-subunit alcohol dehydrogenase family)